MSNRFLSLEYLSHTGFIGFWLLFIGLLFTGIIFYFVFFRLNEDNDYYKNKERKVLDKETQRERIARLYPKKN